MPRRSSDNRSESERYDLYDLLDRLEELLEDMDELGVGSLAEAEAKIADLNRQIDELEASASS